MFSFRMIPTKVTPDLLGISHKGSEMAQEHISNLKMTGEKNDAMCLKLSSDIFIFP
jgi:hypothetical protein